MSITKQKISAGALKPTIWKATEVIERPLSSLMPYANNNKRHAAKNINRLKDAVSQFGFVVPIVIDKDGTIICGHGRYYAANELGMETVPAVMVEHLSEAEVRALRIADNKLTELSDWNEEALQIELGDLAELDIAGGLEFDLTITGFDTPELDLIIGGLAGEDAEEPAETVETPDQDQTAVTQPGDIWVLGAHRILCGNSLKAKSYIQLMKGEKTNMIITDPPYNVQVQGHVRIGGGNGHREFAMASGEMSETEFRSFLLTFLEQATDALQEGGIIMAFMDWRHIHDLIIAGHKAGLALINLCVWNKTNGGMGSLYRSKHELVCIFKKPGAAHVNNVELGRHGRNRTNVWDYAGVNSFGAGREADLADHPTVKPTALVADAILDVSHRGDVVLDGFGGSGSTLLAAEQTGRRARLIELDPLYVDVSIRRWQALTGKAAVHAGTGESYDERAQRLDSTKMTEMTNVKA